MEILPCDHCGTELPDGVSFCARCGHPVTVAQLGPVRVPESGPVEEPVAVPQPTPAARTQFVYAGFWLRAAAFAIDTLIYSFLFTLVAPIFPTPLMAVHQVAGLAGMEIPELTLPGFILFFGLLWIYYGLFESSKWQATPGKRALRLYVTDLQGHRLTLWHASLRYFGRWISSLTFSVGYLMAGFTQKKQALHDILARCLVLRR